jgi:hypothetical protein
MKKMKGIISGLYYKTLRILNLREINEFPSKLTSSVASTIKVLYDRELRLTLKRNLQS